VVAEESQPPSEPVRRYVEPRFPYCPSRASLPESSPGPQSLCSSVAFPWRTTQELTGPPHTNGGVPAWLPSTKCRDPGPLHNFSCYSCLSHRHKPLVPSCPCPSPRPTSGGELVSDDLVHLGADLPFESTPDSGVDLSRERRGCGLVDPSLRPAKPRQRRGPRVRGLPSGGGAVCRSWRHASGPPRACPWRQQHGEGRPLRRTYIGDGGDVAFVESGPQIPATDTDGRGSYPVVGSSRDQMRRWMVLVDTPASAAASETVISSSGLSWQVHALFLMYSHGPPPGERRNRKFPARVIRESSRESAEL